MSQISSNKYSLQFLNPSTLKGTQKLKDSQIQLQSIVSELKINGFLPGHQMRKIIDSCQNLLINMPNLVEIKSPVMVVGDIHGQFYDLLNIFQQFGKVNDTSYLFLGDYVDRGQFCIEVITLLLCMKIKHPSKIHLLRGNHQSRVLTSTFNFREQCTSLIDEGLKKYDQQIYMKFVELFDMLSLGAIVDGKYFCVHAGISPELKTINEIQQINRFKEPPEKGGVCDLLWSDPIDDLVDKWMPNKNRMCSYFYGVAQSKSFLQINKLKLIIRGHEVENLGYKYQKQTNGKPLTLTIFSAPNYCDSYRNKGSVLYISGEKLNIFSYCEVEHPLVLPNYMNIIEWSMPFLAEQITKLFKKLLKLEKSKEKKSRSDKILNNENVFRTEVQALTRLELIEKIVSQKKLKNEEEILRQNIRAICQYSTEQFVKIKSKDDGEKHPLSNTDVIGPKLHQSFKKLSSLKSIHEGQQQDSINFNQEFLPSNQTKQISSLDDKIEPKLFQSYNFS